MAIGFKEWSLVCEFLGNGSQSLIVRKGGIAEGRDGFQFRHPAFFLFPTHFHEQEKHLKAAFLERLGGWGLLLTEEGGPEEIPISLYAEITRTRVLHDWEEVQALNPFHAWNEQTVRERFDYKDAPGISVAVLRVYRLPEVWVLPSSPRFGGCRSWLELPECPDALFREKSPVLDPNAFREATGTLPLGKGNTDAGQPER